MSSRPAHFGFLLGLLLGCVAFSGSGAQPQTNALAAAATPEKAPPGVEPVFSPAGGVFSQPVTLRVTPEKGCVVRFTLDGSEPTDKADSFDKEMRLSASTLVKARAFRAGVAAGPVVSQTYILVEKDLEKFRSHLPVFVVNTFGKEILHSEKVVASVRVIVPPKGAEGGLTQSADFDGRGEMRLRGNSSLRYLKRSYALKTRDEAGESLAVSLLGFPKDSDWILYAPYPDKTLMRDVVAYELSRQMGHYASRTRFVEVFVNQIGGKLSMRHYAGVFVLEEKIKRAPERVNIKKLTKEDNAEPNITGGYIFKKDHFDTYGEVPPTVEGRPMGFGGGSSRNFQSGPGGFPGDPKGFLNPQGNGRRGDVRTLPAPPDNTSFIERLRGLVGPNDGPLPPPQPGTQAPPLHSQEEAAEQLRAANEVMIREGGFRRFGPNGQPGVPESFSTSQRNDFYYVEPKAEDITPAQRNWLRNHLNQFERVLHGPDFKDPVKGYAAYIDADSFIDQHLLVEITKNIDGFRFSTFYQKERGGKIRMQPVWDWNLSFGNANGKQGWLAEYWYWPQLDNTQYSWFRRLFEDPDFAQRYVDRWGELRTTVFSATNILTRIDALVAELGSARTRNFQRWPILGRKVWPNTFVGRTYEEEIDYMKDFIRRRLTWIEDQFVAAPVAMRKQAGSPLQLTAAAGQIYFSLDGSDPRASGGAVARGARAYSEPVQVPPDGKLVARALVDGRWSPPTRL